MLIGSLKANVHQSSAIFQPNIDISTGSMQELFDFVYLSTGMVAHRAFSNVLPDTQKFLGHISGVRYHYALEVLNPRKWLFGYILSSLGIGIFNLCLAVDTQSCKKRLACQMNSFDCVTCLRETAS